MSYSDPIEVEVLDTDQYKAWLVAHRDWSDSDDKEKSQRYDAVRKGYEHVARMNGLKAELPTANALEKVGIAAQAVVNRAKDLVSSISVKTAPIIVGQMIGQRTGGQRLGRPVGGAIGGIVGSVSDQIRRGDGVRLGETVSDMIAGAATPKSVGGGALLGGGLSVGQQLVDEGQVDLATASGAAAMAGVGTAVANKMTGTRVKPEDAIMIQRYNIMKELDDWGVVVNPEEIRRGIRPLNTFAGVEQTSALAAQKNQSIWNKRARLQADLPVDGDLSFTPSRNNTGGDAKVKGTIEQKLYEVAQPYRDIVEVSDVASKELADLKAGKLTSPRYLRPDLTPEQSKAIIEAKANLQQLKEIRFEMKNQQQLAKNTGDPAAKAQVKVLQEQAKMLEDALELAAASSGDETMLSRMVDARRKTAVLHAIDDATTSYGTVDPAELSALRELGVPLTGDLEKMALFYDAFKRSGAEIQNAGSGAPSGTAANYTARNVGKGNIEGWMSGGFPFLSTYLSEMMLEPGPQRAIRAPLRSVRPDSYISNMIRKGSQAGAGSMGSGGKDGKQGKSYK